jgi:multidrug transporter EmrE-like cation transporter
MAFSPTPRRAPSLARSSNPMRVYSALALFLALRASGNLSLAWGAKHLTEALSLNLFGYLRAMLQPFVALGIVLLIAALLARLALLSVADLSFVLPTTAIGYVLSALCGEFFLGETVHVARWAGVALVLAGAVLVGLATANTTKPEDQTR